MIHVHSFILLNRKIKKSDPQQSQQQSTPITNENKENLLTRSNKQPQSQQSHQDNESAGFDCSSSVGLSTSNSKKPSCPPRTSSPKSYDKHLSTLRPTIEQTSKIHVDVNQHPTDKLLQICDSSEPSPRDLTDITLSCLPPHKVNLIIILFHF